MWKCNCGHFNADTARWCENCDAKNPNEARRIQSVKQAEEQKKADALRRAQLEADAKARKQRLLEEAERKRQEQENTDAYLKANGHEGFYEYQVLSLVDSSGGSLDISDLAERLNALGRDGWRLKCAFANEIGHNSTPGNAFAAGTNATIDQSILIFERFVKFD